MQKVPLDSAALDHAGHFTYTISFNSQGSHMKKVPFVSKEPHFTDEDAEIQSENGRNESSAQVHPLPESMLFSTTPQHSSVKVLPPG